MDCKQCAEDLTAFLDGELNSSDSEQIRSHLAACLPCSEELRSLRETAEFVESHNSTLEPRAGSWNMVRARIMAEREPERPRFWLVHRWKLATATLAVAAAFAFGYLQYQQSQRRDLDLYMSRYIQQREAQIKSVPASAAGAMVNTRADSPYADNPFIEIKATPADNPFLSEGR